MRILLVALLVTGLAAGEDAPPAATKILDDLIDVDQTTDYTCGPSALEGALSHYGVSVSEGWIAEEAHTDPEVGAQPEALAKVAKSLGVEAEWRDGGLTIDDLAREVREGNPVLVLIQAWREKKDVDWKDDWDDGHYLVVIGVDDKAVYCEDPSLHGSRGVISREEFLVRWHCWTSADEKAEHQGMLFRRGKAPAPPAAKWERVE